MPVVVVALPAYLLSSAFLENPLMIGFVNAFFGASIPEESFKYLVLTRYAMRRSSFDEPMDGLVYGVAASLGFATFENILYVSGGGLGVAVLRALTAVPLHATLARSWATTPRSRTSSPSAGAHSCGKPGSSR